MLLVSGIFDLYAYFFLTFEIFEKQNHQMWQKKEYIFRNEYKIPA